MFVKIPRLCERRLAVLALKRAFAGVDSYMVLHIQQFVERLVADLACVHKVEPVGGSGYLLTREEVL